MCVTKKMYFSDIKVKYVRELIEGIRLVKMYCWESNFKRVIDEFRKKEVFALMNLSITNNLNRVIMMAYSYVTLFSILFIKYYNDEELNLPMIFGLLYLLNYLAYYAGTFLSIGTFYGFELHKVI